MSFIRINDEKILNEKISKELKELKEFSKKNKNKMNKILDIKNKQVVALESIINHLNTVLKTSSLNESLLEEIKYDEIDILRELDRIKKNLNN